LHKRLGIILLFAALLITAGCWSRNEVENLAIVSAVGVDRVRIEERSLWKLTFEVFLPRSFGADTGQQGGGITAPASWIVSSVGETLEDARVNFNTRTPRRILLAHSNVIVIGEETARTNSLHEIADFFIRSKDVRLRNWFLVTEGTAEDMLTAGWELEQDLATELLNLIELTGQMADKVEVLNLKEVARILASPGRDMITGWVEVFQTPEKSEEGGTAAKKEQSSIRLHGSAIFLRDRMVGRLSDLETRGYLFLVGKAIKSSIPFTLDKPREGEVSIDLVEVQSRVRPRVEEGQLIIQVEIEADGDLSELVAVGLSVDPELMEILGEKTARVIEEEAAMAVARAQEMRADIFGFGEAVRRKYPRYWKQVEGNWREHFAVLPVEIQAKVRIRRTGMITDPISSR
jgi:spore germination protein KC